MNSVLIHVSMCSIQMNFFLCFIEMEGLCLDYHHGASMLEVIDTECSPKGMKVRSQPSAKDPFSVKEILHHPGGTEMPRKERDGLRHH